MADDIGEAAGKIWNFLDGNEAISATKLAEQTGLAKNDMQKAIGWLAREGKINIERRGKSEYFALAS